MAERDISPSSWAAQREAKLTVSISYPARASGGTTVPILPDTLANSYSYMKLDTIDMALGDNTITVPSTTNTKGVFIVPPTGHTVDLKLKGAAGDTGVGLATLGYFLISWDGGAPPASFIVNATAALTGVSFYWF